MKLVKKGAISYRSALFFHNLTDQMMHSFYITVPRCEGANLSIRSQYKIQNTNLYIRRVAAENFFGIKRFLIEEASVWITDIERYWMVWLIRNDARVLERSCMCFQRL